MENKKLGKIKSIKFGIDSDFRFGVTINLEGNGWGVSDFWEITNDTRTSRLCPKSEPVCKEILYMLTQSNKSNFEDLKDIPIEVTFKNNTLDNWRILTEVL